jgi:hypothetical protein
MNSDGFTIAYVTKETSSASHALGTFPTGEGNNPQNAIMSSLLLGRSWRDVALRSRD